MKSSWRSNSVSRVGGTPSNADLIDRRARPRAQEQAREHADRGEFEQVRKLLSEAADELRTIAPRSNKADELLQQAQTIDQNVAFMTIEPYSLASRKQMRYEQRRSQNRRKRWPS